MLEILLIIHLVRSAGQIAERKGLSNVGTWKIMTGLAWIGGEIFGAVLAVAILGIEDLGPLLAIVLVPPIILSVIVRMMLNAQSEALSQNQQQADLKMPGVIVNEQSNLFTKKEEQYF